MLRLTFLGLLIMLGVGVLSAMELSAPRAARPRSFSRPPDRTHLPQMTRWRRPIALTSSLVNDASTDTGFTG